MKQRISAIILLSLLLGLVMQTMAACAPVSQETAELWVVTEQSTWDRMNGQLYVLEKAYEEAHSNVDIKVDYLPTDEQERDVYLQQLRTEILQGGGPDCYLLPTDNTLILDEPAQYTYVDVEPLFSDVDLAMRNGLFYDITELYDADDAMGKDALNTKIMDAGVVNGTRYVLPLRYDVPIIYAKADALEAAGMTGDILKADILTIMEAVLATDDPVLASGILYDSFSAFSSFLDYNTGNAQLDAEILQPYVQTYGQLKAKVGETYLDGTRLSQEEIEAIATEDSILLQKLDLKDYIYGEYGEPEPVPGLPDNVYIVGGMPIEEEKLEIYTEYYPLHIGSIADCFSYAAVANYEDTEFIMEPLRSVGGDVVATVTYYAAVGSGCRNPELAYDFLRQFLLEESQREMNRPERNHTKPVKGVASNTSNDLQYPGLIGNGWPVRDKNVVEDLWKVRRKQTYVRQLDAFFTSDGTRLRMQKIGRCEITEDQIPVSDIAIDQVRFNTTLSDSFADTLATVSGQTDAAKAAEQLVWLLRWHVSEG